MREEQNLGSVVALGVDMVGFIEYPPSPRYAPTAPTTHGVQRVGVFVNESVDEILSVASREHFTHVQLHGKESREVCEAIRAQGYKVIKAVSVSQREDLAVCAEYHGCVDLLLFDTKTPLHGGSGERFDWGVLSAYEGETPFLLSGGIDETMAAEILKIEHPKMVGVDLNSRFEIEPALKDIDKLKKIINEIR